MTFVSQTRCFDLAVRILSRIFKRPGERVAERLEHPPTADSFDTNDKIASLAAEITGKPADLKPITGDKKPAKHKTSTFDPAAYQRAKRSFPGSNSVRFDPQIPVS